MACDLAARGFDPPKNVLEGPFGYFKLIESSGAPARIAQDLGRRWLITELAHKSYPSDRATHGIVEACLELQRQHGCPADAIERVTAHVPPLVCQLVGRPHVIQPTANYARMCATYVAARALLNGRVGFEDFRDEAYRDVRTVALTLRISIESWDVGNANALAPQSGRPPRQVSAQLRGGSAPPAARQD